MKKSVVIALRACEAKVKNYTFAASKQVKLISRQRRKTRILFSIRMGCEKAIKRGFFLTRHEIIFDEFTPETLSKADIVVPLTISDLLYLDQHRALVRNNPIPIPTSKAVQLCDDKSQLNSFLIENGFQDVIPAVGNGLDFPYLLKKKVDIFGLHCYLIADAATEKEHVSEAKSAEFFKQQIITGRNEYACHILFDKNQIEQSLCIHYEFDKDIPIKGQDKLLYYEISDCPFLELFSDILRKINFEGICCFNYKIRDGKPFIFEINPRFGGSLCSYFFIFFDDIYSKHERKTKAVSKFNLFRRSIWKELFQHTS